MRNQPDRCNRLSPLRQDIKCVTKSPEDEQRTEKPRTIFETQASVSECEEPRLEKSKTHANMTRKVMFAGADGM
jgi:hypothetical protein